MALVVFDVEVPVPGGCEREFGDPPFEGSPLVRHLVAGVDAHRADDTHGQRESDFCRRAQCSVESVLAQVGGGEQNCANDQAAALQGDVKPDYVPVEPVIFRNPARRTGWNPAMSSEEPIGEGQNEIEDNRSGPGEQLRDVLQPEIVQHDEDGQEQEYGPGDE